MKSIGHIDFLDPSLFEGDLSYGNSSFIGNYQKIDQNLKLINDLVIMWFLNVQSSKSEKPKDSQLVKSGEIVIL